MKGGKWLSNLSLKPSLTTAARCLMSKAEHGTLFLKVTKASFLTLGAESLVLSNSIGKVSDVRATNAKARRRTSADESLHIAVAIAFVISFDSWVWSLKMKVFDRKKQALPCQRRDCLSPNCRKSVHHPFKHRRFHDVVRFCAEESERKCEKLHCSRKSCDNSGDERTSACSNLSHPAS